MAYYKYLKFFYSSSDAVFDVRHAPGTVVANPGIYRCAACGREICAVKGQKLEEHEHPNSGKIQSKVEWQLIVFPEQLR